MASGEEDSFKDALGGYFHYYQRVYHIFSAIIHYVQYKIQSNKQLRYEYMEATLQFLDEMIVQSSNWIVSANGKPHSYNVTTIHKQLYITMTLELQPLTLNLEPNSIRNPSPLLGYGTWIDRSIGI